MNHEIKMNRSRQLAPHLPSAQAQIDEAISPFLLQRLTARELAEVRRCLNAHWQAALAFAESRILDEGCIWSPSANKLLEIPKL